MTDVTILGECLMDTSLDTQSKVSIMGFPPLWYLIYFIFSVPNEMERWDTDIGNIYIKDKAIEKV